MDMHRTDNVNSTASYFRLVTRRLLLPVSLSLSAVPPSLPMRHGPSDVAPSVAVPCNHNHSHTSAVLVAVKFTPRWMHGRLQTGMALGQGRMADGVHGCHDGEITIR